MTPEQQRLFDMLAELVEICDANDLTYYVAGGTTLGAVRHGGFIPWDDDVDLMMPKRDWLALVDIARHGGLPENRVLNCQELDVDYPHVFGRYTDTTSCAIHYNQMLGGTPEGFIIDIFILDPVPDAGAAYERHCETLALYNDLSNALGYSYPMSSSRKELERYAKRIKAEGRRAVLGELEAKLSAYEGTDCDYLVMRWAAAPRLFKKELYVYRRTAPFEGIDVCIPAKCNDYLVQHYGDDWMYLPSESGRMTHDAITFLDVDYKTVQDDYLPFIDVPKTKKAILNRRAYHIRHMDDLRRADDLKAQIISTFVRMVTLERAQSCDFDMNDALANSQNQELEEIFSEFYKWQWSPDLAGREEYLSIRRFHKPIYIDIGDDLLRIALLHLANTNRVAKAARILKIRELANGELSPGLAAAKDYIEAVRTPPSLLDVGCEDDALEFSRYLAKRHPENFSNRVLLAGMLYARGEFEELKACAEEGMSRFPESGEFAKYLADCRHGKAEVAASAVAATEAMADEYARALSRTTHAAIAKDAIRKAARVDALCKSEEIIGEATSADERHEFEVVSDEVESTCTRGNLEEAASKPTSAPVQRKLENAAAHATQRVPNASTPASAQNLSEKLVELLAELDDICNRNQIQHWLGFTSCKIAIALNGENPGIPALDMFVPASQFDDLAQAIAGEGRQDRALDYWKTNKNHISYQMDYVDTTTTFLQLEEGTDIAAHGIKITITPVRTKIAGRTGKRLDIFETGWEANGYQLTKKVTKKRIVAAGVARAGMVLGRKRLANHLYTAFNKEYGSEGVSAKEVIIKFPKQEPFACDARLFAGSDTVTLGGRAFPAPKDIRALLEIREGANWESKVRTSLPTYKNALISADIPYGKLLSQLKSEGHSVEQLFSLMRRIRISMLPMANDLRVRNRAMLIARRTEDRKRWHDYLHAHDEQIRQLREANDREVLATLFAGYEKDAKRYLKSGLGLCPSKRYLDILCEILREKGEAATAEQLRSLSPKSHYEPL